MGMRIQLQNRIAEFLDPPTEEIERAFSFSVPGAHFIPSVKKGHWDGRKKYIQKGVCPAGVFLSEYPKVEKNLGIRFVIEDLRSYPKYHSDAETNLRDYQEEAVERMIACSRTGGIILAATGVGKTKLVGGYLRRLQGAACFVVDELALLHQARESLSDTLDESVGVIGEGRFEPRRVTVATVQTLFHHRADPVFKSWKAGIEIAIVDEVHVALNQRHVSVVRDLPAKACFGLTGTLNLKKKGVRLPASALCGPLVYEYSLRDGIEEQWLSESVVLAVDYARPLKQIIDVESMTNTDIYRAFIVKDEGRNKLISALLGEAAKRGRKCLCLVEWTEHLDILNQLLTAEGIAVSVVHGVHSSATRQKKLKELETGQSTVLIATKVFRKGIDAPCIDFILDAASVSQPETALQAFGRGMRKNEGKDGLIFVDVGESGNHFFGKSSNRRRRAFRKKGIRVENALWPFEPAAIITKGISLLKELG